MRPKNYDHQCHEGSQRKSHSHVPCAQRTREDRHPGRILESYFRAQLDYARASAAQAGIGLGLIWRLGDQTLSRRPWNHKKIRKREIRMIKDVEELRPELQVH